MRNRTRVVITGVAVALTAGVSGVALAAGSPKPAAPACTAGQLAAKKAAGGKTEGATSGRSLFGAESVASMAASLGITDAQARDALDRIERLARASGGITPTDPAFVAIARGLRVTPRRLASALGEVKRAAAGG